MAVAEIMPEPLPGVPPGDVTLHLSSVGSKSVGSGHGSHLVSVGYVPFMQNFSTGFGTHSPWPESQMYPSGQSMVLQQLVL